MENKNEIQDEAGLESRRAKLYAFNSLVVPRENEVWNNFMLSRVSSYNKRYITYSYKWLFVLMVVFLWCADSGKIEQFKDVDISWWEMILYPLLFWLPSNFLFNTSVEHRVNLLNEGKETDQYPPVKVHIMIIALTLLGYWLMPTVYLYCWVAALYLVYFQLQTTNRQEKIPQEVSQKMLMRIKESEPKLFLLMSEIWGAIKDSAGVGNIAYYLKKNVVRNFTQGFAVFQAPVSYESEKVINSLAKKYENSVLNADFQAYQKFQSEFKGSVVYRNDFIYGSQKAIAQIEKDCESLGLNFNYVNGQLVFLAESGVKEISNDDLNKIIKEIHRLIALNEIDLTFDKSRRYNVSEEFKNLKKRQLNKIKVLIENLSK